MLLLPSGTNGKRDKDSSSARGRIDNQGTSEGGQQVQDEESRMRMDVRPAHRDRRKASG